MMDQTVYYVTLRVADYGRRPFGVVQAGQVQLNAAGQTIVECWQEIGRDNAQVHLDAFVIMPNHLHGLIIFGEQTVAVGTGFMGSGFGRSTVADEPAESADRRMQIIQLIGQFAAQSVDRTGVDITEGFWHRPYEIQLIQSEKRLNALRHAIYKNPANWAKDRYYVPTTDQDAA